jgi:uncharacterized protein DUF5615
VESKLDENVHGAAADLAALGHDARTFHEQALASRPGTDVAAAIKAERRCLVTFDLDFADPRLFPRSEFAGLVVLRLHRPTARRRLECITRFSATESDVVGQHWIVWEFRARNWTP